MWECTEAKTREREGLQPASSCLPHRDLIGDRQVNTATDANSCEEGRAEQQSFHQHTSSTAIGTPPAAHQHHQHTSITAIGTPPAAHRQQHTSTISTISASASSAHQHQQHTSISISTPASAPSAHQHQRISISAPEQESFRLEVLNSFVRSKRTQSEPECQQAQHLQHTTYTGTALEAHSKESSVSERESENQHVKPWS